MVGHLGGILQPSPEQFIRPAAVLQLVMLG
jgi:hypothetical protein